MSRLTRLLPVAVLVLAMPLAAAPVPATTIKLATQAPSNSIWHNNLTDFGAQVQKATDGRVALTVYADGSQGDEQQTVRKMRLGTLNAALLTAGGLAFIDKAFNVFTIPFFFETDEQEIAVQKALTPKLQALLEPKGFHLLCWGTGGWVQIFSKKPLKTLADVKAANLYASKDDDEMMQWYIKNGFHPKGMTIADIAPQLKLPNGMIDTTPNTPYLALATQIFTSAKYMLDVHIAPLVGAAIVDMKTWNALSADDRAALTAAAEKMETTIRSQAPQKDTESVKAMTGRGLQVITPDKQAQADFRKAAGELGDSMRGGMVPADIYDAAKAAKGGK